ncbi:MAG: PHP domain-containing protein [Bacteroidetes bacterium]|nr:MAG: PHP domain-containing protein [Bacteroidota bacterium]
MKVFKADLHVHTVLSPCGSLEMSPAAIVKAALEKKLDIIGITDHNSTRQCRVVINEAKKAGLTVYSGAEVTTREEVHCLAFFENFEKLDEFQLFLDANLPDIKNDTGLFGYQVVVNEQEEIVYEEEKLLISAIGKSIDQVEKEVHRLGGLFIPAHVNRSKYSLISQLGFIPPDLKFDALELTKHQDTSSFLKSWPYLKEASIIRSSDAHQPEKIGEAFTRIQMENTSFKEFAMALRNAGGREVIRQ